MIPKKFSYLHKSDRQVLLTLLMVAGVIIAAIYLVGGRANQPEVAISSNPSDSSAVDRSNAAVVRDLPLAEESPSAPAELFPFDPNTADSTELLRLGLSSWQVRNIYKFRAAGGVYQRKEDFAQLYGLTVGQYEELAPYIHIACEFQPASTLVASARSRERSPYEPSSGRNTSHRIESDTTFVPRYPRKIAEGEHVVLNLADTTQLRTVPGIGPYYSKEIVRYGQRLGGYVSVDQLDEIDLFPTESKRFFVIENPQPKLLNVNQLTLEQLRRHPYINYYQARAIIDYRRQHGPISTIDELSLLPDFPPEAIDRLRPYLSF